MSFFGQRKDKGNPAEPKSHSLLGSLLIPDVSATIRPMQETTSVFVKLIAMIFVMNGLLPKDYLTLSDMSGNKINLSHIFTTAWRNLSFTTEGAPKIALFFAVTGTLVFSCLIALTVFILMFTGKAHAASSTFFTAPGGTQDLAYNWLEFLFKGNTASDTNLADSTYLSQIQPVQTALVSALAFYSNAILVFAAFILFYHLVSMVVETAHHGQPMGKRANQIWAPIRLVVAVGLLVPVSSTGLNCGQYIAVQMAEWGSGLASNVWQVFVSNLLNNSYVAPPAPYVRSFAEKIVLTAACVVFQNYDVNQLTSSGISSDYLAQNVPITDLPSGDIGGQYTTKVLNDGNSCGKYIIHQGTFNANDPVASAFATAIFNGQQQALTDAYQTATSLILPFVQNDPPYFVGDNNAPNPQWQDIIDQVADTYDNDMTQAVSSATSALSQQAQAQVTSWTSSGWIAAGAFFNKIANAQGDIESAVQSSIPDITGPTGPNLITQNTNPGNDDPDKLGSVWGRVGKSLDLFTKYIANGMTNISNLQAPSAPTTGTACNQSITEQAGKLMHQAMDEMKGSLGNIPDTVQTMVNNEAARVTKFVTEPIRDAVKSPSLIDKLARIVDTAAILNCVWNPAQSGATDDQLLTQATNTSFLGIYFGSGNPYTSLVRLGYGNLNTAYLLLNIVLVSSIIPVVSLLSGMIAFIATAFFVCGFTLAYFLPLVPFMTFLMNSITWVIMVLESVIMMPLVALAHLNPEGDGLPGQNARNAYFFLFSILLRPTMMIFGLIAAWLISVTGIVLMNKLYMFAVTGSLAMGGDAHVLISRIVFSIMYVVIVYIICHKSFHLIAALPNHAMSWIGAQDAPKESMGSAAENLGGTIGVVSSYAGNQAFDSVHKAGASAGAMLGKSKVATMVAAGGALGTAGAAILGLGKPQNHLPQDLASPTPPSNASEAASQQYEARRTQAIAGLTADQKKEQNAYDIVSSFQTYAGSGDDTSGSNN